MDEQGAGKRVNAEMSSEGRTTVTATLRLWKSRYEYLLDAAKKLRDDGHPEAAIVMAQSACEACMELVLTKAVRARVSDAEVADFILTKALPNYSPTGGNTRLQELYKRLFGKPLRPKTQLWKDFDEHAKRRNSIVHRGHLANEKDADKSIAAVEKVIRHLLENQP